MPKRSIARRTPQLETLIYEIRGQRVMLDSDLAGIYGKSTGALNRAVKRNRDRFPIDFMFRLTRRESETLRCQIGTLKTGRGQQVSVETGGGGLFTSLVADALEGGAADIMGDVTAPGIYSYVEEALGAWDQRPLFKSHVAKLVPIRKCEPAVDLSILRDLPKLFPLPAEDLPLSPEFETSCDQKEQAKVEIFCKLQALNRVHLVIPVGVDHMYDAAMQSKACRLTASGRYYWRLASTWRI